MVRLLHFLLVSANCLGPGGHGGVQYLKVACPSHIRPRRSKKIEQNLNLHSPVFNNSAQGCEGKKSLQNSSSKSRCGFYLKLPLVKLGNVTGCFFGWSAALLATQGVQSFKCKQSILAAECYSRFLNHNLTWGSQTLLDFWNDVDKHLAGWFR